MNGQGFVSLTGHDPYRTIDLAALKLDLHHVAGGDPIALGALRGDPDGVVPGHLVLRLRHLLKPRVVGHRSVADGRIGTEYDFKTRGRSAAPSTRWPPARWLLQVEAVFSGRAGSRHYAVMQGDLPEIVEVGTRDGLPASMPVPCRARIGRRGSARTFITSCGSLAAIERHDQRLDDADRAIVGARIAPGLQIVRLRDVPVAPAGGFIRIEPQMCP